jgi:hypothetical protein
LDPAVLVVALIYLNRICVSGLELKKQNLHLLFSGCILLAYKFLQDRVYNNKFFARVTGIPLDRLNCVELNVLMCIKFDLMVTRMDFRRCAVFIFGV